MRTSGVVLDKLVDSGQSRWFSGLSYDYKYGDGKLIPGTKKYTYSAMESKTQIALPYKPEEIYNFAQWAFSLDGLPNPQVLA